MQSKLATWPSEDKGNKAQAEAVREECRSFLEDNLKLTLNMEKTHITHVNDGFVFLGHRIIRKRGPKGTMRVVSGIPKDKAKAFAHSLSQALSNDYSCFMNRLNEISPIYETLKGWECNISKISSFNELPDNAKKYVQYLEGLLNTKITIISIGPERNQIIKI